MFFSIITPCFKSTKTLRRTYESLLLQDEKDFEWILIDDASPDGGETRKLILELAEEAPFDVKYEFLKENHFGSKSVYTASLLASGKFACILDHDDELIPTALADVKKIIHDYDIENREDLAGVCGRCVNENKQLIGPKFSENSFQANEGNIRFRKKITCELFQFTKVEIISECFSKIKPGYTNGYCWAKVSEVFDYIFTNSVFRVYDTYNPASYSNNKSQHIRNPKEKMEAILSAVISYRPYLYFNMRYTLRMLASAKRHSYISKCKPDEFIKKLPFYLRVCYFFTAIPAYLKWKFF